MARGQWQALAFRFLAVWLFLYWQGICLLLTPFLGGLYREYYEPIWDVPTRWFAAVVLRIHTPLGNHRTFGSDSQYYWTRDLLFIVLAVLAAIVWTALRRHQRPARRAWGWLWLGMRLVLGMQMLFYGLDKLVPVQMPEPAPSELLTRLGDFTPMQVLWVSMGSAPWYESATGLVEVMSGVLLALPGVWAVGALLAVVAMAQVTLLDLFYDVPVKLHCTHLLAMAVILLLPYARPLLDVLVANRTVASRPAVSLTGTRKWDRAVAAAAALIVALFAAGTCYQAATVYSLVSGPDTPKPPLYGAWKARGPAAVSYFAVDGYQPTSAAEIADPARAKASLVFELADGSKQKLLGAIDQQTHQIALTEPGKPDTHPVVVRYEESGPDQITLSGERLGPPFDLVFDRVRLDQLPLRKDRGVHWVDEAPITE